MDFSSYSDIAIGLGLLLGYHIRPNFNLPFVVPSIPERRRRWHISMSHWFRDYIYFPLGGNRHGRARTLLHIMIVMFLSGLWHGAYFVLVDYEGRVRGFYDSRQDGILDRLLGDMNILINIPGEGELPPNYTPMDPKPAPAPEEQAEAETDEESAQAEEGDEQEVADAADLEEAVEEATEES